MMSEVGGRNKGSDSWIGFRIRGESNSKPYFTSPNSRKTTKKGDAIWHKMSFFCVIITTIDTKTIFYFAITELFSIFATRILKAINFITQKEWEQ